MWGFILSNKAELQRVVLLLLAILAWWRGGGPEKASATVLLLFLVQDPLDWLIGPKLDYSAMALRDLVLDCVVAGLLLAIALRANRVYTLCLASWQLMAVLAHLGRVGSGSSASLAYSILMYLPSYLLLLTLALGVGAQMRRVTQGREVRSWWKNCPPWKSVRPTPGWL